MEMKTLALLSLSLAVALGMPPFAPGLVQNPVLIEEEQSPLLADWVPVQGHVVVEDPAPQVRPGFEEQQEKLAPVPVDMEKSVVELEIKEKPQVKEEQEGEVKTEVKPEPDVRAEAEFQVKPQGKDNPEVKEEQELKADPELKEPEVKLEPEVKVEPEVKLEPEVKVEPEVNLNPEVMAEPKVDVKPEAEMEPELNNDPEFKVESEVKVEPDVLEEFQVQMNLKAETESGREIEEKHIDMEGKYEMVGEPIMEPMDDDDDDDDNKKLELNNDPELKVESEVKVEPDVQEEFQVQMNLEAETESGREFEVRHIDMEGKYEMVGEPIMEPMDDDDDDDDNKKLELNNDPELKVEPDVQEETEPEVKSMFNEGQEVQEVQMDLEEETEPGEIEEWNTDMQGKYKMVGEPIMELLEPLDDDNMELSEVEKSVRATFQNHKLVMSEMDDDSDREPIMELVPLDEDSTSEEKLGNTELSEVEKSVRATFQNEDPVNQPLPEEEEEEKRLMKEKFLDEEPIMELVPEEEEPSVHQQVMSDAAIMEEGPALDIMGQPISRLDEYYPNEEARMGMEGSDYLMMEEPGSESVREEELSPMAHFDEPAMEDGTVLDGGVQFGVAPVREKRALMRQRVENTEEGRLMPKQDKQGRSCSSGVTLEGKCYQFFKGPKTAADAEFFCQDSFPGGHLASITTSHIHRQVMYMMRRQNGGFTRAWIGGLRYLETGRFIWLDGSRWAYADWLLGEPNNTADVEDCVEVLPRGNGKFNDFTCWEPQAFICSHPY